MAARASEAEYDATNALSGRDGRVGSTGAQAETRDSFAAWLRSVKLHAGDPSLRTIERGTKQLKRTVARSTLHEGLAGERLFSLEQSIAVVTVLAGDGSPLVEECRRRWIAAREFHSRSCPRPASMSEPEKSFCCRSASGYQFAIDEWREGAWAILRVTGEIDFTSARALRERCFAAVEHHEASGVVLDLTYVTFQDSVAIGAILYVRAKLTTQEVKLRVVFDRTANTPVYRIWARLGLDQAFFVHGSLEAATSDDVTVTSAPA